MVDQVVETFGRWTGGQRELLAAEGGRVLVGRVDHIVGVVVDVAGCRVDKVVVGRVELVEGQVEVKASLQLSQVSEEGGRLNHVGGKVDQLVCVVAGRVVDSFDPVVIEDRVEEVVDIAGGGAVSDGVGVGGG